MTTVTQTYSIVAINNAGRLDLNCLYTNALCEF